MFAKIPFKINKFLANMGRATAGASQIYCVVRGLFFCNAMEEK